mmetsp:Transcript_14229/g.37618  ORF Transcript_14229/g.37618 Transcript_14229/m.37618 type:complete len:273 (-) Transcript_14229:35-853(-)
MVIATFEAQDPAEMSCEELELLRVSTDPAPDGWCLASKGGAEGLVPKDYVVRLQPARLLADFSAEEEGEMAVTQGETVLVLPRPAPEGWAFVKRAADSAQGLVPADYLEDAAQESGDPGGVARSAMDLLRDAQPALVTADFEPEDAVELKVAAGELVLSLEQPAHAPGWTTVTKLASPEAPPGLVPTDYLEMAHGEMSAEFTAEEVGELSCGVGVRVWLTPEQPDGADGWSHVISEAGGRGLVPRAYIHFYPGYGAGNDPAAATAAAAAALS